MTGTIDIAGDVELLVYPACPQAPGTEWQGWFEAEEADLEQGKGVSAQAFATAESFEQRIAEEKQLSFEAGRERGQAEGRQVEREAQAAAQKAAQTQCMRQSAELITRFTEERDRYLSAVEHEVVKLALAIAARILRREAQMDPLLLTGAVRVALGQLSSTTDVRLLVPAPEFDLWSDAVAHLPNLAIRPTVRAGDGMRLGECILETTLGSVDLGIRSQLGEIERGFFDRAGSPQESLGRKAVDAENPEHDS